jgi:hypothetical protein
MLRMVATLRRLSRWVPGAVVVVLVACGGSSNDFSDGEGDAGESSTGGTNAGSGGTQGGSVASGGDAGTVSNGGTSGNDTGGNETGGNETGGNDTGGSDAGGSGGTITNGGTGTGGAEAGAGGTISFGGTSGFGGSAGSPTGGVGGMPDSRCPLRTPSGPCTDRGLSCRYSAPAMCLCATSAPAPCSLDPRCTAMMGAIPPNGDRIIPASTSTCTCFDAWSCTIP